MTEKDVRRLLTFASKGPGFVVENDGVFFVYTGTRCVATNISKREDAELFAAVWDLAEKLLGTERARVRADETIVALEEEIRELRASCQSLEGKLNENNR